MSEFDLALLPTLEALLRERGVTAAARAMGRSQPAVSRDLARLREQLRDPLLIRTRNGTELTHRAREVADAVFTAADELRRALHRGAEFVPGRSAPTFRVSIGDYESAVLLPAVMTRLMREAPEARLSVLHRRRPDAEGALATGEVGLAIGRFERPGPLLHHARLFEDEFCICLRRALLRRHRASLDDMPFLLIAPSGAGHFDGLYDQALARRSRQRRVVLSIPYFLLAGPLLLGGDLAAVLPVRVARLIGAGDRLAILPPPERLPGFRIDALWHGRTENDPAYRWLRDLFLYEARRLPASAT